MTPLSGWSPSGATDPGSSDPEDLGDFGENQKPPHTSQKNLVFIAFDPRTNTLLSARGGFGTWVEDPPTPMEILRSDDCGRTWLVVSEFEDFVGDQYGEGIITGGLLYTTFYVPTVAIPGDNPGDWMLFDYAMGYYVSTDNGVTWSERQYAGVDGGVEHLGGSAFRYFGGLGGVGFVDPAHVNVVHDLAGNIGAGYAEVGNFDAPRFGLEGFGVRRRVSGGWEDSLAPSPVEFGGSGWVVAGSPYILLGWGNGRWIAVTDYTSTLDDYEDEEEVWQEVRTPNVRINTSPSLDPSGWQTPTWLVSESWCQDMYQGEVSDFSFNLRLEFREPTTSSIKFIPIEGHPVGGRWWIFGLMDSVVFSDDNGETWSNALADHTGPAGNMHPFLNWRREQSLTTRLSHTTVMNIVPDMVDGQRQIALGVTYDRTGVTNRLAVYSCSVDGGDTWGPVGQLPITSPTVAPGSDPNNDRTGIGRYGFPCLMRP